jgi:hypothetical protein
MEISDVFKCNDYDDLKPTQSRLFFKPCGKDAGEGWRKRKSLLKPPTINEEISFDSPSFYLFIRSRIITAKSGSVIKRIGRWSSTPAYLHDNIASLYHATAAAS